MKMFLTRFGMRSRMVICGDPPRSTCRARESRACRCVSRLEDVKGIAVVPFTAADVVRHPLVGRIVEAYEGPGTMMLEVAIEADPEWDSSTGWDGSSEAAAEAAICRKRLPQLDSPRQSSFRCVSPATAKCRR
jgi:hypothetical protein